MREVTGYTNTRLLQNTTWDYYLCVQLIYITAIEMEERRRRRGAAAVAMNESAKRDGWHQQAPPDRVAGRTRLLRSGAGALRAVRTTLGHLYDNVLNYTKLSSMHGLRYIGDSTLHPAERFFWAVAFLLAVGCSAYFISNLFIKFNEMPVIVSLSPTSSTIRDIPFPTITICNMNNMRKSQAETIQDLYEITKGKENLTSDLALDYKLIFDFCNREPEEEVPVPKNVTTNWDYIKKFMIKMSQPCHEMLVHCKWHGDTVPCDEIFNPNLTDEGMCCVFNRLKRDFIFSNPKDVSDLNVTFPGEVHEWTPEKGYPPGMSFETIPRRARGSGTHLGLTVVADAELYQYYCSSGNSKGFKTLSHDPKSLRSQPEIKIEDTIRHWQERNIFMIFLSNPLETPKVQSFGFSVAPSYESKVIVIPRQVTSTKDLQSIAIEKRSCYFESERQLFFYKTYTQRSCILECEANYTIAMCHCVQYYMPKNETTRICGRLDADCAKNAQRKLEISINDAFQNLSNRGIDLPSCECLPGCYELSYGFRLSSGPITTALPVSQEMMGDKGMDYFKENMGILHFYYIEKQFSGTVKGVLFGFTEFLSNTGGLLGLFMGFSFLSGVEIIYFLAMRFMYYVLKIKRPVIKSTTTEKMDVRALDINFLNENNKLFTKNHHPFIQ